MPASSLSGLADRNVFAPTPNATPSIYDYYRQGQQAVQSLVDQQNQQAQQQYLQQFRAQQLAEAQKQADLQALLQPWQIQRAQIQTEAAQLNLDSAKRQAQWDKDGYPLDTGGIPTAISPPVSSAASGGDYKLGIKTGVGGFGAPDSGGFYTGTGTVFAGPHDLADFAKNKSLNTGDNGIGAWNNNTKAGSGPQVALPTSFLQANGIDPSKALGLPVTLKYGDKTVQATIGDKGPQGRIDLNPDAAAAFGVDPDNFKGQMSVKLGGSPAVNASQTDAMPGVPTSSIAPVSDAFQAAAPTSGIPLTLSGSVPFSPNLPTLDSASAAPATTVAQPTSAPTQTARAGTMTPQVGFWPNNDHSQAFVPSTDHALAANANAQLRTRLVPTVSPGRIASDNRLIQNAERYGVDTTTAELGDSGALTDASRADILSRYSAARTKAETKAEEDALYGDDTLEYMARLRMVDPSDPRAKITGMGPRSAAARAKLDAMTAEMGNSTGQTGADAVVAYAGVAGAKQTLKAQEKQRAAISSFEQTARDNAKIALDLMDKGAAGANGIPVLNRWIQAGRKATGDPDVAAFNTAIGAFTNEYAKIISGNIGAGGATDASRREAAELINKGGTVDQLRAQLNVAFQEMENRTKSIDGQIDRLNESIQNAGKSTSQKESNVVQPRETTSTRSSLDQQALDWANAHPNDPRAAQIKQRLGL